MMRVLIFACFMLLIFSKSAHAIDFTISNATASATNVQVTVSLSDVTLTNCPDNICYLQGTLRSQLSTKFFGETQNNVGTWIDYITNPDGEFVKANLYQVGIINGKWLGVLNIRFKLDDSNYFGPGEYELTLNRYTGKSTSGSSAKSNTLSLQLFAISPSPSPLPTPTPTPSPSPSPTPSPTPLPTIIPTPTPKPSPSPIPSPIEDGSMDATVAGVSTEIDLSGYGDTPSPSLQGLALQAPSLNRSRLKTVLLIGSGLIIVSVASFFGYRKYLRYNS